MNMSGTSRPMATLCCCRSKPSPEKLTGIGSTGIDTSTGGTQLDLDHNTCDVTVLSTTDLVKCQTAEEKQRDIISNQNHVEQTEQITSVTEALTITSNGNKLNDINEDQQVDMMNDSNKIKAMPDAQVDEESSTLDLVMKLESLVKRLEDVADALEKKSVYCLLK